jgi:hypothetical protein
VVRSRSQPGQSGLVDPPRPIAVKRIGLAAFARPPGRVEPKRQIARPMAREEPLSMWRSNLVIAAATVATIAAIVAIWSAVDMWFLS